MRKPNKNECERTNKSNTKKKKSNNETHTQTVMTFDWLRQKTLHTIHRPAENTHSNLIERLISGDFRLQMISLGNGRVNSKSNGFNKPDSSSSSSTASSNFDLWCLLPQSMRVPKMNSDGRFECPRENCQKSYKETSSLQRHVR